MTRRLILLIATLLLLAGASVASLAVAQSGAEVWADPVNVSRSGTAGAPQIVDLGDELLIFWEDDVDHFAFARSQNGAWSAPATAEFPFATRVYYPNLSDNAPTPVFSPQLAYDGNNFIHAFWWDEEAAFHSRVAPDAFGSFVAWSPRQRLAEAAVQTTVTVGADGRLHLVYVRRLETADAPAGVYYRGSQTGGLTWSDPQLLYASRYVRLPEGEDANLQIAAEGDNVYVALDDAAGARILFIRSEDEGVTWQEPFVVDRREAEDRVNDVAPSAVRLAKQGGAVHLTWRAGHQGQTCLHYHLRSEDGGRTWEGIEPLLPGALDCSQEVGLLSSDENVFLVATTRDEETVQQASLSVWIDGRWRDPETQGPLSGFTHPETFRSVSYGCGREMVVKDGRLLVASCGNSVGQDVWFSSRSLSALVEQVRATPVWAPAVTLPSPLTAGEGATLSDPLLVADGDGRFHAFWSQASSSSSPGNAIYYARWAGGEWSRPIAIVSAPGGMAAQPSATSTADGRLLLVWSGGAAGELLFSWAPVEGATSLNEWRPSQQLPSPQPATSAPHILVDRAGVIVVVYAVPLNEGRGIYMTTSADQGTTWSEPVTVFDGAAAGWAMVDAPRAAVADGLLHLMWEQRSLPGNVREATLYYARSDDDGLTWSTPQALEGVQAPEARALWGQIVAVDGRIVHRAWQEWDGSHLLLWHQVSLDGGLAWSRPARVGGFVERLEPAHLLQDAAGRVYLVQRSTPTSEVAQSSASQTQLQLWQWQPALEEWASLENADVASSSSAELAAAVSGAERLTVVLAAQGDGDGPALLATGRELPAPEAQPTQLPTLTPSPAPTAEPTATQLPRPTATSVFPTTDEGGGLPGGLSILGADSRVVGGLLALSVTVILVFVVLIIVTRLRSGRQR